MNAGILPIVLLFAATGLSLAFASLRDGVLGAAIAATVATIVASLATDQFAIDWIFAGLWISAIAAVALMYLRKTMPLPMAAAVGLNAGAWAGAFAASSAMRPQTISALPILLVALPGNWLAKRGYGIALKVVGSWIMAIAILAIFVSLTPLPGYKPDHME